MKKKLAYLAGLAFLAGLGMFTSCIDTVEHEDTAEGNFEALWRVMDEHYCFLDYKQQVYGLDWNAVYNIYNVRAKGPMNDYQLF